MSIKSLDAASAYAQALQSSQEAGGQTTGLGQADQAERAVFSSFVEDQLGDMRVATETSELTAAKAIAGQADMVDVVTAASNAELVVSTMTAVRDKVISSYNEIIKMPI